MQGCVRLDNRDIAGFNCYAFIAIKSINHPTKSNTERIHMIYLALIFLPPVYFLTCKQWGGFFLNVILYGLAILCVLSIVGIIVAPVFWILAVGHASFTYRREQSERHAELLASKMAAKLRGDK